MNKIVKYPNPILRKKATEVKELSEEIKKLAGDMIEIMIESQGIGLAAPQIGESKRIIVVQMEKGPQVFINPKIIAKSKEKALMEEGCLCFPKLFLEIKRAKKVQIEAVTIAGEKVRIEAEGLLAHIFQHEVDHLDGILFIDRVSFSRKLWRLLKI